MILDMATKVGVIVTLENHCVSGGLFSLVAETLATEGCQIPVGRIGTDPEDFIHTGHVNDLLARYRMTSDHVVQEVERLLGSPKARTRSTTAGRRRPRE
jgi:transketolase C-terminal domain/subunit